METEAYRAVGDKACHTFKRPSARDFVAAHQAGDAYVYLSYGMHWLFNILIQGPQAVDLPWRFGDPDSKCLSKAF